VLDLKPRRLLGYVRDVGVVKRLGTDTVNGVETAHYATEIDPRGYEGGSFPVDVWIDGSRRIRRVQTTIAGSGFVARPVVDVRPH
jgi:hypothetical protein